MHNKEITSSMTGVITTVNHMYTYRIHLRNTMSHKLTCISSMYKLHYTYNATDTFQSRLKHLYIVNILASPWDIWILSRKVSPTFQMLKMTNHYKSLLPRKTKNEPNTGLACNNQLDMISWCQSGNKFDMNGQYWQ